MSPGKPADDGVKLSALELKPGFKIMMMGSLEEDITSAATVPENVGDEVINDLDLTEEEIALENREEYLNKVCENVFSLTILPFICESIFTKFGKIIIDDPRSNKALIADKKCDLFNWTSFSLLHHTKHKMKDFKFVFENLFSFILTKIFSICLAWTSLDSKTSWHLRDKNHQRAATRKETAGSGHRLHFVRSSFSGWMWQRTYETFPTRVLNLRLCRECSF